METTPIEVTSAPPPAILNGAPAPATWAPAQPAALPMPIPVGQIVARMQAVKEIVKDVLEDGVHYGYAFGDGKTKDEGDKKSRKCLLKPGFDVLCLTFQFQPDFQEMPGNVVRQDFVMISYKCLLTHIPTGRVIATGIGSCNSKEEKYRWKPGSGSRACPECGKATIFKAKDRAEFYCWAKKGGCGAKFPDNDQRITAQKTEREENDNAYNHLNTIQKMAQKRAGIAAIIPACGLSNEFTQDLEDIEANQAAARPPQEEWAHEEPPVHDGPGAWEKGVEREPALTAQHVHNVVRDGLKTCTTLPGLSNFKGLLVSRSKENSLWFTEHVKEMLAAKHRELTASPAPTPEPEQPTQPTEPPHSNGIPAEKVMKAVEGVNLLLKDAKTHEDFARIRDNCKTEGGVYTHPVIVQTINNAYKAAFPEAPDARDARHSPPPATGEVCRDRVKDIQSKSGPKKDGSEYTRFTIETEANGFFTTFNPELAERASQAKAEGSEVEISFVMNGRWKDIRDLKLALTETTPTLL
jgi:hypothetical protein